jgi:hypothetical protein
MATQTLLNGSQTQIEIAPGGYTIQAPDLVGRVMTMTARESATRSEGGRYEDRLLEAMSNVELDSQNVFEIEVISDSAPGSAVAARSGIAATTRDGEPAILLRVPSLGQKVEQAVLYADEAGVSRWIFPESVVTQPGSARGGAGEVVFHLPRLSAPTPPAAVEGQSRGPISKLGRRLVRVFAWATDDIIGKGAFEVARRWESSRRPYAFRRVPLNDSSPVDWNTLANGRSLLLIHGTFSSAASAFSEFPPATIDELSRVYEGRLFAFDHPSLHQSPKENVKTLFEMLPPGIQLDLDIVTHSRGGLVGRELTERIKDFDTAGRRLTVGKAILVAAPNLGTILTDGDHGIDMLDRYTNLLTNLPDNAFTLTMEGVLMMVKLVLHGALKGLPGLECMYPKGDYLKRLNASPPNSSQYFIIGANFTPNDEALLARFAKRVADKLVDGIFGEENDGVVPTRGSYESAPHTNGFPVNAERRVVFDKDDQIHHCNYFGKERTCKEILQWLGS